MDADSAAVPTTGGPDLWATCEERAVVRLTLASGQALTGSYTSRVGLHFLHRTGRDLPLIGEVTGPYQPGEVLPVEVVRTRAQVLADAYVRLHGERVPGREPQTRDEHEQRLQVLAGAVAAANDDWQREMQLHRQFREAADRIGLAQGKRTWLLTAAAWARHSNAAPTMADLWVDAVASPSQRQTLRVSATSPGRARRTSAPTRRRGGGARACLPTSPPTPVRSPNMLHALRAASLKARAVRLGDPRWDRGHLQVEMPVTAKPRSGLRGAAAASSPLPNATAMAAAWHSASSGTATTTARLSG